MTAWPTKKLGELADICRGSSPRPICDTRYFEGGTVPWVKIADATKSGKFLYETKEHVNDYGASFSRRLPPGTILVAASGTLGYTQILGVEGCAHDGWLILQNLRELDRDFAYYALKTLEQHFFNSGSGAAIQNINTDILRQAEIPHPPLPVQRRIATILSAYDELVENSQRRIRTLEAMARALYRGWFVHFRFPGHEKRSRVASPLGNIPKGWEVRRVPECVDISPRVAVSRDGEKPFVPMGCLANDSMIITDIESRGGNSGAKFQNGDTLFARITPCLENGKTGFVQFLPSTDAVACGSTEFIVLRSRTLTPEFVYLLARSDEFRGNAIKSMSGATGRQRVQERCFDDFKIAHPPRDLLDRFSAIVAPSFRLIQDLHLQTQNLRRTRDLLLPRLMSGQIEVNPLRDDVLSEEAEHAVASAS